MNSIEANKAHCHPFLSLRLTPAIPEAIVDAYADEGCVETMGGTLISGVFSQGADRCFRGAIFEVFPQGLSFEITGHGRRR